MGDYQIPQKTLDAFIAFAGSPQVRRFTEDLVNNVVARAHENSAINPSDDVKLLYYVEDMAYSAT